MPDLRLRQIDATNIQDHYRLTAQDDVRFLYEYTAHAGYAHSATNNLISNLKKKPSQSDRPGYHYKAKAIRQAAADLAAVLNPKWLDIATLVPVPSSKAQGHPDFDDRVTRICNAIRSAPALDVRELVTNTQSHEAAHEGDHRPSVEDLLAAYQIDEGLAQQKPANSIGIVDDVLTAGTHFRAIQILLSGRFPDAKIFGIFIARRTLENPFAGFDLDNLNF